MFQIKIEHNLDEIIADLEKLEQKLRDLSTFWRTFALPVLLEEADAVFDNQGYGNWPGLSPYWAAEKPLIWGPGRPLMRASDHLYDSLTQVNALGSVQEVQPDSLTYGTDVPYAYFHEFGITPPQNWGRLPKRAVLENFSPQVDVNLESQLENYIGDLIKTFETG